MINSELTSLQKSHKHLRDELVRMHRKQGYPFLYKDEPSYLDCTQAVDLDENDVMAQLLADPDRDLKMLTADTRKATLDVVANSLTLDGGTVKLIARNLGGTA